MTSSTYLTYHNLRSFRSCQILLKCLSMTSKPTPTYFDGLDKQSQSRYLEKIALIGGKDPYLLKKSDFTQDINKVSSVAYPDIANYLIYTTSAYTSDELKSYKGLEAYNQFVSGWVRELSVYVYDEEIRLHTARVLHSQRLRETALSPWAIIQKDGRILAAHCNCMAGLGEACTHIAATLFAIEASVKLRESKTVTQEKSYWLPASIKNVPCSNIDGINFTSAKTMKRNLDLKLIGSPAPQRVNIQKPLPKPTTLEKTNFYQAIYDARHTSGVLRIISPWNNEFVPKALDSRFPKVLTDLADDQTFQMNYRDLLEHCATIKVEVTKCEADAVEESTRDQAKCVFWNRFRSGRITASRMKAACHSQASKPSRSLINAICHPSDVSFKTAATEWGCAHEKVAKDRYQEEMTKEHDNFQLRESGFIINPAFPIFGASPDGLCSCDCCGEGVVEIKCPYCIRHCSLTVGEEEPAATTSCLEMTDMGLRLRSSHQYAYQVQTQLHVSAKDYCDFVVWTEKEMHTERIEPDSDKWTEIASKASDFHRMAVMPELVGKFFSRVHVETLSEHAINTTTAPSISKDDLFCICREPETPDMIACDNENCPFQWFHFKCMKMNAKSVPKGKWYCDDCSQLPEFQKRKRTRRK